MNIFHSQLSQSLIGVVVNLLLLKCVSLLRLNKAMAAAVSTWKLIFSNLLWLLVAYWFTLHNMLISAHQRLLPLNYLSLFLFRHLVLLSQWPSPVSATWYFIHSHLPVSLDLLIRSSLVSFAWATLVTFTSNPKSHQQFILELYSALWFHLMLRYVLEYHNIDDTQFIFECRYISYIDKSVTFIN